MVPGAKLKGNLLTFVDQTVLFLFERRKDSTNFPIHCFSMMDILAGDMLFFQNTQFKQFLFLNLFFTAFYTLHLQPVKIKKRISLLVKKYDAKLEKSYRFFWLVSEIKKKVSRL